MYDALIESFRDLGFPPSFSKLKYSCFRVLCQFLLQSKVTQLYTHTHTHTYTICIYIFLKFMFLTFLSPHTFFFFSFCLTVSKLSSFYLQKTQALFSILSNFSSVIEQRTCYILLICLFMKTFILKYSIYIKLYKTNFIY